MVADARRISGGRSGVIIVPEIDTVVILTPRCGSGSLRDALLATYPKAMMVYRHMEADGVPHGYDRWRRVGVVRDPVDRLWSLWKFLQEIAHRAPDSDGKGKWEPAYVESLNRSLGRCQDFSDWIVNNDTVFTSPYDIAGKGRFWPGFTVLHSLPENRKSQFTYLRPDLGTEVWQFHALEHLASDLGVKLGLRHQTANDAPPPLSHVATDHVGRFFAWDLEATSQSRAA